MRQISKFIAHCSATPNDRDASAEEIRRWHVEGNGWRDIGYHFVIRRDGALEFGRPIEEAGAHVRGHNHDSIGVCLVGLDQFNHEQFVTMIKLYGFIKKLYPAIEPFGHRDFTNEKTCPNFEVREYIK